MKAVDLMCQPMKIFESTQKVLQTWSGQRIAVFYGGQSNERAISLKSGAAVIQALEQLGCRVVPIDLATTEGWQSLKARQFDWAFPIVHGHEKWGEGGGIQSLLDLEQIPFPGSNSVSSALAMDKVRSKHIWQGLEISTPVYGLPYDLSHAQRIAETLGYPLMMKPICGGSSLGITRLKDQETLIQQYSEKRAPVFLERCIQGEEFTVGILDDAVLPTLRIETVTGAYDFDAKYVAQTTRYHCPSGLSASEELAMRQLAWQAFHSLGCQGWGRVDILKETHTDRLYVLEVNTLPGMTERSLLPKAAAAVGLTYSETVLHMLDHAYLRVEQTIEV